MPNLYSAKTPPSKGKELGDVYFCNATKETFVVLGSLQLFNMAGLLSGNPVAVVGPPVRGVYAGLRALTPLGFKESEEPMDVHAPAQTEASPAR
jgi:hypothetical protein